MAEADQHHFLFFSYFFSVFTGPGKKVTLILGKSNLISTFPSWQALFSAHAEDSAFRKGFLECKQIFIENAKIAHFWENFSVWKHCFVQTNREWKIMILYLLTWSLLHCKGPFISTICIHLMPKLSKSIFTLDLMLKCYTIMQHKTLVTLKTTSIEINFSFKIRAPSYKY